MCKMNCVKYVSVICLVLLNCLHAQENYEKVEGVAGQSVELPCNITAEKEDDKLNILAWYKNGSNAAFYSRDLRGGDESATSEDSRYRLVTAENADETKLEIIRVQPSDAGLYTCLADFAASPAHKTYIELTIIEPPRLLWMVYENGTQVATATVGTNASENIGPYFEGDTIHLACVAYGGSPLASLEWRSDKRLLKDTGSPISEHRIRSDLIYGPLQREDHGRVFTCFANNNAKTTPLSIDVTIDMYLSPALVSLKTESPDSMSVGRVKAGEALPLQCRVLGARPLPPITWKLGDNQLVNLEQNITMEPPHRLVKSDIQLTVDRHYDESHVTCCAPAYRRDSESLVCAEPLPLTVLYPPVLEIAVNNDVVNNTLAIVKGSNVSLACNYQANPSVYELLWFHREDMVPHFGQNMDTIQRIMELINVTEDDAGEYACVATNNEGSTYSDPLVLDVTYPAYCEDETLVQYGLRENEAINLTCNVKANPEPVCYQWLIVNSDADNVTVLKDLPHDTIETNDTTLLYARPSQTTFITILCWGQNEVATEKQLNSPCRFLVTDKTIPRPPRNCEARKTVENVITITCEKGHDGGLPQTFKFVVKPSNNDDSEQLVSITDFEPKFIIPAPNHEDYKFAIIAFNEKGESSIVEIEKQDIIDETKVSLVSISAVSNITTLALALCGGVALVALAACGLVLFTYERAGSSDVPRDKGYSEPPLCAYNTEESNCETYHDSDDGSDCNVRRTDSFRRAMSRRPSKNFDVRRTSSFHSTRYLNDVTEPQTFKAHDTPRHSNSCRVHSLQNIHRKRDVEAFDHLVLHRPPEPNYNVPRPMNTFYTMPRKMRHKLAKELSDETSEITQTSDGFSLPPPPDEFGTYRAASRIKDFPTKSTPSYTTVVKNNSIREPAKQYSNIIISPMNTVGLPAISGGQHSGVYSYPDDDQGHQATLSTAGVFQTYFTPEAGL